MMKQSSSLLRKCLGVYVLLSSFSFFAQAQVLRSSYFMESATNRIQLNPALQPNRGYVNIPVIGSLNAATSSNSLSTGDVIDVIGGGDSFYKSDAFINRLSTNNRMNVSLNTDIISFGFYKGKGFWSANIGLRADVDASIPKSMFEYLRSADSSEPAWATGKGVDIRGQKLNLSAFTEVGVGYSRPITDRLTVGGKVKFLLGMANMKMDVNQLTIQGNLPSWEDVGDHYNDPSYWADREATIRTDARLEASLKGFELSTDKDGMIDDFDMNGFGIAGYGGAIDLGATYKVLDNLTVSAAVIDLGFISYSKSSTTVASAEADDHYDESNYRKFLDRTEGGTVFDFDLIGFHTGDATKSRVTSLASTLVVGGEYGFFNNQLSAGLLSTTRFGRLRTVSELTLSANYRPKSWLNATFSYSMIQSQGKSFGLAFKVDALMLGTDYMYLGGGSKCMNGYLGISIPLGAKKKSSCSSAS